MYPIDEIYKIVKSFDIFYFAPNAKSFFYFANINQRPCLKNKYEKKLPKLLSFLKGYLRAQFCYGILQVLKNDKFKMIKPPFLFHKVVTSSL